MTSSARVAEANRRWIYKAIGLACFTTAAKAQFGGHLQSNPGETSKSAAGHNMSQQPKNNNTRSLFIFCLAPISLRSPCILNSCVM